MSTQIGALHAILSMNAAEFAKGTKAAEARLASMQKSFSAASSGIKAMGVAWGAQMIGREIVERLGKANEELLNMGKLSAELGLSASQLSGGLFSDADIAGVVAMNEQVGQLSSQLDKMAKQAVVAGAPVVSGFMDGLTKKLLGLGGLQVNDGFLKQSRADDSKKQAAQKQVIDTAKQELAERKKADDATAAFGKEIDAMNKSLEEQVMFQDWSADQIAKWRLMEKGATKDQLDAVAASQAKVAAMNAEMAAVKKRTEAEAEALRQIADHDKAMQADADALTESLRTPAEVLSDELDKMRQLLDADKISQETFDRGLAAKEAELIGEQEAIKDPGFAGFASALERGSSASISALNRFKFANNSETDPAKIANKQLDVLKQLLVEARKSDGGGTVIDSFL